MDDDRTTLQLQDRIFYDGECGLCHAAVRFVTKRMPFQCSFRFAPLGGATFQETVVEGDREGLGDSIVVQTSQGELLTRSAAAIYVMKRLGPGWQELGSMTSLVPRKLSDAIYDLVARNRSRLFRRPETSCPILPERLRNCFDP